MAIRYVEKTKMVRITTKKEWDAVEYVMESNLLHHSTSESEIWYLFEDYHEAVKLWIKMDFNNRTFQMLAEVRTTVPFFADNSHWLDENEMLHEISSYFHEVANWKEFLAMVTEMWKENHVEGYAKEKFETVFLK